MQWFEVDRQGLAQIVQRHGKAWVLYELIQNGWDQKSTTVNVSLIKQTGERYATLAVEDDDPNGFTKLSDAFTLFAPSEKKGDPTRRGRFNLGEKLVLALCDTAEITTTTGSIRFDAEGRHHLRRKRDAGSLFLGRIKMTNAEFDDCVEGIRRLIPPVGIVTTFTAEREGKTIHRTLRRPSPLATFDAALSTEIADDEGILRPTVRKTLVEVFETDRTGWLYEMGIPVVETGDTYDVNVGQKVPLTIDRANVRPAYLRDVRTLVLNAVHDRLSDSEQANASWVRDAVEDERADPDAIRTVVQLRFGDKAVAYDPSDREANHRAVAAGYVVVHGNSLSKEAWENVRRANVLIPAGRVMPTPKPYSDDPNAPLVKVISWPDMTEAQQRVITSLGNVSAALVGFKPTIRLVNTSNHFAAAYGGRTLDFNLRHLGNRWFEACLDGGRLTVEAVDLLIHELGHEYCDNHLDDKYIHALTRLGGKLAVAVAENPQLLEV